jgi:hypothetical protein
MLRKDKDSNKCLKISLKPNKIEKRSNNKIECPKIYIKKNIIGKLLIEILNKKFIQNSI